MVPTIQAQQDQTFPLLDQEMVMDYFSMDLLLYERYYQVILLCNF